MSIRRNGLSGRMVRSGSPLKYSRGRRVDSENSLMMLNSNTSDRLLKIVAFL